MVDDSASGGAKLLDLYDLFDPEMIVLPFTSSVATGETTPIPMRPEVWGVMEGSTANALLYVFTP